LGIDAAQSIANLLPLSSPPTWRPFNRHRASASAGNRSAARDRKVKITRFDCLPGWVTDRQFCHGMFSVDSVYEDLFLTVNEGKARLALFFVQTDHAMHMIWHNDKRIQTYLKSYNRRPIPFFLNNLSEPIQFHRSIDDLSENTLPLRRANGYEIGSGFSVVESF
jgi:hypothetical protein